MRRIGVVCNLERNEMAAVLAGLIDLVQGSGGKVYLLPGDAERLRCGDLALAPERWPGAVDFAMSLGGDGTLLRTARLLAGTGLGILGVNLGRLGFLTEIESTELPGRLPAFLTGDFVVEERMMLDIEIERLGQRFGPWAALNDAVVAKGTAPGTIHINVKVSGQEAGSYPADGVIISTPTGSTAYSLSAGGPVISPRLDLLVITPICPHSFYARSLVVSGDDVVCVEVADHQGECLLSIDGQQGHVLQARDKIIVRRSGAVTRLIRSTEYSFYHVVRRKLAEPTR